MITFMVTVTGCWDSKELDKLAIIVGTGVDKEEDKLSLTLQVVKPAEIKGGGGAEAVYVSKSSGATVFEAVKNARNQINRRPYFSHNEVIVLGRELAKQGMYPALDYFLRSSEPRPTEWILIADEKATDVFQPKSELEDTPALALKFLVDAGDESKVSAINLHDTNAAIGNTTGAFLIPLVRVMGEGENSRLSVDGSAGVFKRDKMVGEISSLESRGVKWVKGEVKNTCVVCKIQEHQGIASIRIILNQSSLKVNLGTDGTPRASIYVYVEGEIQDQSGTLDMYSTQGMREVKKATELTIKREILSSLRKAQSLKADYFEIGKNFSEIYPDEWKKMEPQWDETFQNMEIKVEVGANLWRVGEVSQTTVQ